MTVINGPKTDRAFHNGAELSRIYYGHNQVWPVRVVQKGAPFLVKSNEFEDYNNDGSETVPLMAGGVPGLTKDGTAIYAAGLNGNSPTFGSNDARAQLRAASAAGTYYRMICYSDDDRWNKVWNSDGTVSTEGIDQVHDHLFDALDVDDPTAHYGLYFAMTPIHPFKYGTNDDDNWTDGGGHVPEIGGIVPPRKFWAQDQIELQAATGGSSPTNAVNFIVLIFYIS